MASDIERRPVPVDSPVEEALLRQIAREHGVRIERSEDRTGVEVVVVLAVVGAATAVAGAIADYLERRKGGQVIDMRKDANTVAYRDKGVVYGVIVIIADDGKVTVDVKEPKGYYLQLISEILTSLTSIATKTIETVAAAAKAAAGDKAEVTVQPAA